MTPRSAGPQGYNTVILNKATIQRAVAFWLSNELMLMDVDVTAIATKDGDAFAITFAPVVQEEKP